MHNAKKGEEEKAFEETSSEQSLPSNSPYLSDTLEEQELVPHVGDEYQTKIPPMLTPSEKLQYLSNPCDFGSTIDDSHRFLIGLPVPITWASDQGKLDKSSKREVGANRKYSYVDPKKGSKGDCLDENVDHVDLKSVTTSHALVPGLSAEPWNDYELDCLLLALYIFGKNLVQVERFLESKEMGEILFFYYGRFYQTAKYRRWSDCRKVKGRKSIIGQRLLSGARLNELFSRLQLSEEPRNTILEASKAYIDGRRSLEEYVSTVKNLVGIRALVEAIGIGKGKDDLTDMAMESSKHNQALSSRLEMPAGRDCSTLTYAEIVKYLTGDFRLSKARSSDLFWEAVWPRLLAKGWHSEEAKDEGCHRVSKNCLVFLIPGVKKFRRNLSKGTHYFDSVSDVLKWVASEPELLMLETEENDKERGSEKSYCCTSLPHSDEDDQTNHQHPRYLKPRLSTEPVDHVNFTIIDTSLVDGGQRSKLRELKNLPFEMKKISSFRKKPAREAKVCLTSDKARVPEMVEDRYESVQTSFSNSSKAQLSSNSKGKPGGSGLSSKPTEKNTVDLNSPTVISYRADWRPKLNQSDHFGPVVKRRRLTACTKAETKFLVSKASRKRQREPTCILSLPAFVGKNDATFLKKSIVSSATSSAVVENHGEEKKLIKLDPTADQSRENNDASQCQDELMNDLNVKSLGKLRFPEELRVELKDESFHHRVNGLSVSTNNASESPESSEALGSNSRRHSIRNRPMSTKALEALESSFFNPKLSKNRCSTKVTVDRPKSPKKARNKCSEVSLGNCGADIVRDLEAIRGTSSS